VGSLIGAFFNTIGVGFREFNLGGIEYTVDAPMVLCVIVVVGRVRWIGVETVLMIIQQTSWHTWGGTYSKVSVGLEVSFFDEVHCSSMFNNNFTFTWYVKDFDSGNSSTEGGLNCSVDGSGELGFKPSREGDAWLGFSVQIEDLHKVEGLRIIVCRVFARVFTGTTVGSESWGETQGEVLSHWSTPDVVAVVWRGLLGGIDGFSDGGAGSSFTTSAFSTVVELDVSSLTVSVTPFQVSLFAGDSSVFKFCSFKMDFFGDEKSSCVIIVFEFTHEFI